MGPSPARRPSPGARASVLLDLLPATALLAGVTLACLAAIDWVAYQGFLLSLLQR